MSYCFCPQASSSSCFCPCLHLRPHTTPPPCPPCLSMLLKYTLAFPPDPCCVTLIGCLNPGRSTKGNLHHPLDKQRGTQRLCRISCSCIIIHTGSKAGCKADHTALPEAMGQLAGGQSRFRHHRGQSRHLEGAI